MSALSGKARRLAFALMLLARRQQSFVVQVLGVCSVQGPCAAELETTAATPNGMQCVLYKRSARSPLG